MKRIRVAGIQMATGRNKEKNIEKALHFLDALLKPRQGLDLVCLPEMFTFSPEGTDPPSISRKIAEKVPSKFTDRLGRKAKKLNSYLVGGSFVEDRQGEFFNTSLLFDRRGRIVGRYSKTHLFDAPGFQESRFVKPGSELFLHPADFGALGLMICYDIRFPELTRTLCRQGAEIIAIPAAFPMANFSPGEDHWQILTRAAALHNMVHVLAVNQIGSHGDMKFFGRSVIVDPWGIEIAKGSNDEGIIYGDIDFEYARKMRVERKVWEHRRPDLYRL